MKSALLILLICSQTALAEQPGGPSNEQLKFLQNQSKILFSARKQRAVRSQAAKESVKSQLADMKSLVEHPEATAPKIEKKLQSLSSKQNKLEFSMAKEKIMQYTSVFYKRKNRSKEQLHAEKVVAVAMGKLVGEMKDKNIRENAKAMEKVKKSFTVRKADMVILDQMPKNVRRDGSVADGAVK